MFEHDPINYNLEQLTKALAAETLNEIGFDDIEHAEPQEPEQADGMWEHIAKVTIDEIVNMYESDTIHPYGYRADEVVYTMRPLLEPYSMYPATHKLLSAIENVSLKSGKDPRPVVNLVVRIFDNHSAKEWQSRRTIR